MIFATLALGAVTITLPARADIRGTEVELGEIATIATDDAALLKRFEEFDLGYSPAPGFSRLFDSRRLADRLVGSFPDVKIQFAGESQVRIHPKTQTVLADEITAVAKKQIELLSAGKDMEFTAHGTLSDVIVPAGDESASLRLRRGPITLADGRNTVPIEILVDGQTYQTVWTTWDVRVWESVLVLTRNVAAGEELSMDSVEYRRMSSREAGTKLDLTPAALVATRASKPLTQGTVLQRNDVVQLELIRRGDSITLEVQKGAVIARVAGVASEAGHLGDRIRVITADTKRELSAIVIGRGQVRINMTTTNTTL